MASKFEDYNFYRYESRTKTRTPESLMRPTDDQLNELDCLGWTGEYPSTRLSADRQINRLQAEATASYVPEDQGKGSKPSG